jgi:hypothetical protein
MHTDVFEFDSNHIIWQNSYVQQDKANSYCGMIDIYDFLSDSFKDKRSADEGYLIGRIFINRERMFFVEGKRQSSMRAMNFGKEEIDREMVKFASRLRDCISQHALKDVPARMRELDDVGSELTQYNYNNLYYFE